MTVMIVCCCSWLVMPRQGAAHGVGSAAVVVIARRQNVGKEKKFDYGEDYHQLDDDDCPQRAPDGHPAEAVGIESPYACQHVCHNLYLLQN